MRRLRYRARFRRLARLWGGAIAAAVCTLSILGASDADARDGYPYCAVSRGYESSYENCSFASFAACLEEIRGLGGYCRPNAYYAAPPPPGSATDGRRPRRGEPR
jgi:uncharacterized protein DUF3551